MKGSRQILWQAFLAFLATMIFYGSWLMLQLTLPYTAFKPGVGFLQTKVFIHHIVHWRYSFYIHVFTGLVALLAGLVQFNRYFICNLPGLHRTFGYVYVIDVLMVTGPAALVMSFYANGGWLARTSFILQSLVWLICTALAIRAALKKNFQQHGEWMLRSYALTLAALTLRTYATLLSYSGNDMHPVHKYILIAWASWVPNLLIAEIMIRSGFIKGLLKGVRNNSTIV